MSKNKPPTPEDDRDRDRGQAFTLEGFVASVLVLTAILLALQSVVLTPTTSGTLDEGVQNDLRTQANDILVVSASNFTDCPPTGCTNESPDLSYVLRFWNGTETPENFTWAFANGPGIGYGSDEPLNRSDSIFGNALNGTFTQRGYVYNVVVEYRDATDQNRSETLRLVYRGVPPETAVSTTYTVTLYDNQTLTGPGSCSDVPIEEIAPEPGETRWNTPQDCFYPIPEASAFDDDDQSPILPSPPAPSSAPKDESAENTDDPIYNLVEIRVIVW